MSGLFGTFNVGKSGLFGNQKAIDVTSHNIANANTDGYSRQRAELQASRPFCMPSLNNAIGPGQLGTGVDVSAIRRIRDNFLDYQVRVEKGVDGWYQGRDKFLSEIENILNEPSDTGISSLVGKFFDAWQKFNKQSEVSNARTMVAQQAKALTDELNHTYSQLQKLKTNAQTVIRDAAFTVNSILKQVNDLNQQIAQVKVSGNNANDLMDRRDLLLDQISEKFGIVIDKKNFDGISVTTGDDAPKLNGSSLNLVQLENPDDVCRFSYISGITDKDGKSKFSGSGDYTVTYYKNGDTTNDNNKVTVTVHISNADEFKQMDECRIIWANEDGTALKVDGTGNIASGGLKDSNNLVQNGDTINFKDLKLFQPPTGEFKGYMSVQQDIDDYTNQLNKLAKGLALSVNAVHSQSDTYTLDNGNDINNFFVNSTDTNTAAGETGITAENITVNQKILDNNMLIKAGVDDNSGESDGRRALAIAQLRDTLMDITSIKPDMTRKDFIDLMGFAKDSTLGVNTIVSKPGTATIDSYFKDTVDRLGIQEQDARRMVKNQQVLLADFQERRDSVSGVSLDEEMANLVQFQHAYSANAKVISTVDQLLDVVINGLKR